MGVEAAKHLLSCRHCIGKSCREFDMRAELLGTMPDGRRKVRVYGRLYWKNTDHISRVRYVEPDRLRLATEQSN